MRYPHPTDRRGTALRWVPSQATCSCASGIRATAPARHDLEVTRTVAALDEADGAADRIDRAEHWPLIPLLRALVEVPVMQPGTRRRVDGLEVAVVGGPGERRDVADVVAEDLGLASGQRRVPVVAPPVGERVPAARRQQLEIVVPSAVAAFDHPPLWLRRLSTGPGS